jgi:hypothetical protein
MHPSQKEWDKDHRARRKQSGHVQVRLWVPEECREEIAAFARELRTRGSEDCRDDGKSDR